MSSVNYIIEKNTCFLNFGCSFCGSFFMLFPKASTSCGEKNLKYVLLHCTFIYINSKLVSRIFKILLQTGDINVLVLRCVFFSIYVQVKLSFFDEKNISGEI